MYYAYGIHKYSTGLVLTTYESLTAISTVPDLID